MAVSVLVGVPRRDEEAVARLAAVGAARAPVVLARDRSLTVPGPLAAVVPTLTRGSVVAVGGGLGAGTTTTVLGLAAAATAAGEWAALVDGSGSVGGLAAAEAGVDLARFAVVRDVPRDRWSTVVAALLDGVAVVVAELPRGVSTPDARRLVARARERSAVLVVLASDVRAWPVEAVARITAAGGAWSGIGIGEGVLAERARRWTVTERGRAPRTVTLDGAHDRRASAPTGRTIDRLAG
ncbi:MAG: hypothetical protein ACXVJ7_02310 [Acidimicrobiia bacterium]